MGLAIYVVAYDAWAARTGKDTMSQSYARALTTQRRGPTLMFWAYLVAHLTGVLPSRWDPLRRWW